MIAISILSLISLILISLSSIRKYHINYCKSESNHQKVYDYIIKHKLFKLYQKKLYYYFDINECTPPKDISYKEYTALYFRGGRDYEIMSIVNVIKLIGDDKQLYNYFTDEKMNEYIKSNLVLPYLRYYVRNYDDIMFHLKRTVFNKEDYMMQIEYVCELIRYSSEDPVEIVDILHTAIPFNELNQNELMVYRLNLTDYLDSLLWVDSSIMLQLL